MIMPTGYTAGILDGKITTFDQFAKRCMRAFGATIHMRDDDMDAEYHPRTPSDYHSEAIIKAENTLKDLINLSDEQIVAKEKEDLEKSKEYHIEAIKKVQSGYSSMKAILDSARSYVPPTEEHTGIKDFMIQQLVDTIKHDCDTSYHDKELKAIEDKLANLDAAKIRESLKEAAERNLKYHIEQYDSDIKGCDKTNKWVQNFLESLS
jgi:hypothetical protein